MSVEKEEKKVEGKRRAEGTVSIGVSAFPIELYKQWKADCKQNFGDCHWAKVWNDHIQARNIEKLEQLEKRILVIELKLENKTGNIEVKTFKKTLKGGD